MISLFGSSGFLGTAWQRGTSLGFEPISRDSEAPKSSEILWLISTTDNYHVFDYPLLDVETNLIRLLKTLQYCRKGSTFNFVSSWFVYGKTETHRAMLEESDPCDPRGFYSITKRAAEQLLISYCTTHGINWRIFRLSNLYGPGDKGASAKKNALTHLIRELKEGRDVPVYWGGDCLRDFLHVTDAVKAIDLCLTRSPVNQIINIGSGDSQQIGTLLFMAKNYLKSPGRLVSCKPSEFHEQVGIQHFRMNTLKLRRLGFEPQIDIKDGIKELCDSL